MAALAAVMAAVGLLFMIENAVGCVCRAGVEVNRTVLLVEQVFLQLKYKSTLHWGHRVHRVHSNENPIYVLLFWELRGLIPNFHFPVSVSDLYFPRIDPHTVFPAAE
jgi:hypothetical protein